MSPSPSGLSIFIMVLGLKLRRQPTNLHVVKAQKVVF